MKILALDQATHCGFAHSDGQSGVWDLSVKKDESSGMRLIRLRLHLNEFSDKTDILIFEASRNMKYGNAVRVAAEIQGLITTWAIDNNVEYTGVSPMVIKKHATGSGNASKGAMVDAAIEKWPEKGISDDNEADALWLLDFAEKLYLEGKSKCTKTLDKYAKEKTWKKPRGKRGQISGTRPKD